MTKFRSSYDLLDFSDNEVYEPGTSETEEGQEVKIKEVYERCLRGELPSLISGDYDIKGDMDLEDAFSTVDVTKSEDFDLADVTSFSNYMTEKLSKGEEIAGRSEEQANNKPSDERVLKANSEANTLSDN